MGLFDWNSSSSSSTSSDSFESPYSDSSSSYNPNSLFGSSSDSFSSGSNLDFDQQMSEKGPSMEEFNEFIQEQSQAAQLQEAITKTTNICFSKCVTGYPPSDMNPRTETCVSNCAARYLDAKLFCSQNFVGKLQK